MRKQSHLIIAFLLLSITVNVTAQEWKQKSNFGGTSRKDASGFAIGNKGYIGNGDDGVKKEDLWEYDKATDVWSQKANVPGGTRDKACGFSVGTKGYVVTGVDLSGTYMNDCQEYDPGTNSWTAKANFTGATRHSASAYSIGNKGYVTCGYDGTTQTKEHWEFDPAANTWTRKADFGGSARRSCVGIGLSNGRGYVGTGWDGSTRTRDWWEYNPGTDTWTQKADFGGTQRFDASCFESAGKAYVGLGHDGGSLKTDFWEYNPATNTWINMPDFIGTGRGKANAMTIGGTGFAGCGEDAGGRTKDWYEFVPCNTWSQKNDFGGAGRQYGVAISIGSKGYYGTGRDASGESQDWWEYEPATDTWTQKADFGGGKRFAAVGCGIGTKGYVGFGHSLSIILPVVGGTKKDWWEYDPAANTWTQKADASSNLSFATCFTVGTKAYVATGQNHVGSPTRGMEEYNPATNTWAIKASLPIGSERLEAVSFGIGNKGYLGYGFGTYEFWEYDVAGDAWTAKSTIPGAPRYGGVGFALCSKGYVGTGVNPLSIQQKDFWEYEPGTDSWTQKADVGINKRSASSSFVIGCKAFVVGGSIDLVGAYGKELWQYMSCCCTGTGSPVGGGGGGGVESRSLGDVIAKRTFNKAKNSEGFTTDYSKLQPLSFNRSDIAVQNTGLSLENLMPTRITLSGYKAYKVSPTDLVNLTNAQEVIAIDYTRNNAPSAVAFATRTKGEVYNHTKQICDRLRGAEIIELKNTTIGGINFIRYMLRQENGNIEYAVGFSAGTTTGRNTVYVQSNWMTKDFVSDETMYNFQLWAANPGLLENMVEDVLTKLRKDQPITQNATNAALPKVYVRNGKRVAGKLVLNIVNNTNASAGYWDITEKKNEVAAPVNTRINFTLVPNQSNTITIPVNDAYEAGIKLMVNGVEEDLLYMADGPWGLLYGNNTTIRNYTISNNPNRKFNTDEYALLRDAEVNAVSKDYVTLYKTLRGGGANENLGAYNSLRFTANGNGKLKITIVKQSITDWNKQYSYTVDLSGSDKLYNVNLRSFKSAGSSDKIRMDDILQVVFSLEPNSDGSAITAKFSDIAFAKAEAPDEEALAKRNLTIYPNPSNGKFNISFAAEAVMNATLKITEPGTGRIYSSKVFSTVVGNNIVPVEIQKSIGQKMYILTVETASGIKYKPSKVVVDKK